MMSVAPGPATTTTQQMPATGLPPPAVGADATVATASATPHERPSLPQCNLTAVPSSSALGECPVALSLVHLEGVAHGHTGSVCLRDQAPLPHVFLPSACVPGDHDPELHLPVVSATSTYPSCNATDADVAAHENTVTTSGECGRPWRAISMRNQAPLPRVFLPSVCMLGGHDVPVRVPQPQPVCTLADALRCTSTTLNLSVESAAIAPDAALGLVYVDVDPSNTSATSASAAVQHLGIGGGGAKAVAVAAVKVAVPTCQWPAQSATAA
jgi:hypothetical protein